LAAQPPLTQDQLAGRLAARNCSLDRVAITKIESGQRHVFDFELPALAAALKVDVRCCSSCRKKTTRKKRETGLMSFDVSQALKRSTGRAKSDVANKLVSMFLHEVSRKACASIGFSVKDVRYAEIVMRYFGDRCLYCETELEKDRSAVEHLEGLNRVRVGLHIPGNVAISCKRCNNEKRRDDQKWDFALAASGWESFLSHNGVHCEQPCKTCLYWEERWPDATTRQKKLREGRARIEKFQQEFSILTDWVKNTQESLRAEVEELYRKCQSFATSEIAELSSRAALKYQELERFE
jgi:hypothetical protein